MYMVSTYDINNERNSLQAVDALIERCPHFLKDTCIIEQEPYKTT